MVKLDLLPHHLKECEHNPKKKVSCEQGCGLTVPKDEMKVILFMSYSIISSRYFNIDNIYEINFCFEFVGS